MSASRLKSDRSCRERSTRRISLPRRSAVVAGEDGRPLSVDGREVDASASHG